MALDVGDKTVGVAVSDELGWAQPVVTVRRKNLQQDLDELARIAKERGIDRLVIGLPINMDGTEGPRAAKTRRFADAARARLGLPVILWDERLSTYEAEGLLKDAGVKPSRRREVVDMVAAQVILKSWLDAGAPEAGVP